MGDVRSAATFAESAHVESYRIGTGEYALDRTGRVVALLPYRFGPADELIVGAPVWR
jgi:hypothetical protein